MEDIENENLNKIEDMLNSVDGAKTPSRKELLDMLEQSEMNDELKENLRSMLSGNAPQLFGSYGGGTWLGILFVVIIFAVLCLNWNNAGALLNSFSFLIGTNVLPTYYLFGFVEISRHYFIHCK